MLEADQTDTSESILETLSSRDLVVDNGKFTTSGRQHQQQQRIAQLETRRVSFPQTPEELVTGYLEPADPWASVQSVSSAELANIYRNACRKNNVEPIPLVLRHINDVEVTTVRHPLLRLSGVWLPASACEALEEILRRVQYSRIELAGCGLTDDTAVSMFDMIEYYESTNELDISENVLLGLRGWEACAKMIKNTQSLTTLEARFNPMKEAHVIRLSRGLRDNSFLCILKLENCGLSGQGITVLVGALKSNYSLKELWIANNELVCTDAIQLSNLLKANFYLQLLDISNNNIEDTGVSYISEALDLQARRTIQKDQERRLLSFDKEAAVTAATTTTTTTAAESGGLSAMLMPPASRACAKSSNRSPPLSPSGSVSSTQSLDDSSPVNKQFSNSNFTNFGDATDTYESRASVTPSSKDTRYDQFEKASTNPNDTSEQTNKGLSVLILWNNKLTKSSASHICKIIDVSENIEILNIGQNDLSDELIQSIKSALRKSTSLLCLGLQSTQLTCEGIVELASVLMDNSTLKRLDLRGNFIKLTGLKSLIQTLYSNFSVTQIDLDEKPKRLIGPDLAEYQNLIHCIQSGCTRNQTINPNSSSNKTNVISSTHSKNDSMKARKKEPNRKISLTCQSFKQQQHPHHTAEERNFLEPRNKISGRLRSPLPSPIPSPSSSPIPSPSRHRFQVSRVAETPKTRASSESSNSSSPSPSSRFRVTVVESNNNTSSSKPKSVRANASAKVTLGFDCKVNNDEEQQQQVKEEVRSFKFDESEIDSAIDVRNIQISVSCQNECDRVVVDESLCDCGSNFRSTENSCYNNKRHRSMFGSTSSLEASTSSIESISMECPHRNSGQSQNVDLNMSLSSNDSFEIESNKLSLISNDSLDLTKNHMKKSATDTEVKEPVCSNQSTLTNFGTSSRAKSDDIKKRVRKTSWVPPKLESWIFDEQKIKSDARVSISKSDSLLSNAMRNFPARSDDKSKIDDTKLPSSLDKLLSIFQHPGGLFTRNSTSAGGKNENSLTLWENHSDEKKVVTVDDLAQDLDNKLNEPSKNNDTDEKLNLGHFPAGVIESMKENISPETTIDKNITSVTLSQLIDNVNKQSSTIDSLKGLVESVVNSTEEKLSSESEHNEMNANISIEVQIKTCCDTSSEIVECVNASEILDNEMKSNDVIDQDIANNRRLNKNTSFENIYVDDIVLEEMSNNKTAAESVVEM